MTQAARDGGQYCDVLACRRCWRQKQKHRTDGLPVNRFEADGTFPSDRKPREPLE
jgi:hypothetical protein